MKKTKVFLILACMTCIFYTSCEKSGYTTTENEILDNKRIAQRTIDDCDECPVDYCCCGIELLSPNPVTVTICGVYTAMPAVVCPQPPNQPIGCTGTLASHNSAFMLSTSDPRALFCLPVGGTLRIFNHGPLAATIRFTCQVNDGDPDYHSITLESGEDAWFESDGSCVMDVCG